MELERTEHFPFEMKKPVDIYRGIISVYLVIEDLPRRFARVPLIKGGMKREEQKDDFLNIPIDVSIEMRLKIT